MVAVECQVSRGTTVVAPVWHWAWCCRKGLLFGVGLGLSECVAGWGRRHAVGPILQRERLAGVSCQSVISCYALFCSRLIPSVAFGANTLRSDMRSLYLAHQSRWCGSACVAAWLSPHLRSHSLSNISLWMLNMKV